VEIQNWPHPGEVGKIHEEEGNEETLIQVYTDDSKQEQPMLEQSGRRTCHTQSIKKLELLSRESINPIWATIFTDSPITLDSIQNCKNHCFLVE